MVSDCPSSCDAIAMITNDDCDVYEGKVGYDGEKVQHELLARLQGLHIDAE